MTEKVLCVDDDVHLLAGLQRGLRKQFCVETAPTAEQGLVVVAATGPYAVVVSDLRMPGMDGIQFLSKVKQLAPTTVRIMLTGHSDLQTAVDAVNEGNIFRFLTKPCDTETLSKAISAGLEQYRLVAAEKELLDKTLRGSIRVLIDVLSLVNPTAFGRATRVQRLVRQLCIALQIEPSWEIDIAAMVSQIGCVTLPPEIMGKLHRGEALTAEEAELFASHPSVGSDLVARVPRLEHVAEIIAYQGRGFDGSGEPSDGKKGKDIPLAARLLKVALDYDTLHSRDRRALEAMMPLRERVGQYDPDVVDALQLIAEAEDAQEIHELRVEDLTERMVLADDVLTTTGALLVSKGQEVTRYLRERLRNFARHTPIREPIRVLVRVDGPAPVALCLTPTQRRASHAPHGVAGGR